MKFKSSNQRKAVMSKLNDNKSNTDKFQDRIKKSREETKVETPKSKTYGDATNEELEKEKAELEVSSKRFSEYEQFDVAQKEQMKQKRNDVLQKRNIKEEELDADKKEKLSWYDNEIKEYDAMIVRKDDDIKQNKEMRDWDNARVEIINRILKNRKEANNDAL